MRLLLFLLFIAVPLIELAILIKVGEIIGVGATILLVVATAVIGVSMLKRQGLAALDRARAAVEAGEFPVDSVVDGVCLLVAGAFLLTPGILTDAVGFALLIPALRRGLASWLFNKLIASGSVEMHGFGTGRPGPGGAARQDGAPPSPGPVIEGEYEDVDEAEPKPNEKAGARAGRKASPWRR